MSSQKKIITINPAFLAVGKKAKRSTTRKKPKKSYDKLKQHNINMRPNTIKKDLLRRIKAYQNKNEQKQGGHKPISQSHEGQKQFRSQFQDAMKSLEQIVKQKKQKRTQRKHDKQLNRNKRGGQIHTNGHTNGHMNSSITPIHQTAPNLSSHTNKPHLVESTDTHLKPTVHIVNTQPPVQSIGKHTGQTPTPATSLSVQPLSAYKPDPPYGCLKGGHKQTYRQYHQTLKSHRHHHKQHHKQASLVIEDKPQIHHNNSVIKRKEKLQQLKNKMNIIPKKPPILSKRNIRKHTVKQSYHLGKRDGKVFVLIKNKKTRRRVEIAVKNIERTPLIDIKCYLKKQNLLKTGSCAPEYILRELYVNSMLAGSVFNKNADVLVHNYFSKE